MEKKEFIFELDDQKVTVGMTEVGTVLINGAPPTDLPQTIQTLKVMIGALIHEEEPDGIVQTWGMR